MQSVHTYMHMVTHSHLTPIPGVSTVWLTPALGMQSVRTYMHMVTHNHLTPIPGVSAVWLIPALGMQSVRTYMQVEPSYIKKNMNNFLKTVTLRFHLKSYAGKSYLFERNQLLIFPQFWLYAVLCQRECVLDVIRLVR